MVAAFNLYQARRWEGGNGRVQEFRGGKRVAGTLKEEHRRFDAIEVRVADAFRLSGRVQGIAQENEPAGGKAVRDYVRSDSAAHRLAAEVRLLELRAHRFGNRAIAGLEARLRVRRPAAGFDVREVEAQ